MNFEDSPAEAAYRAEVRAWLAANADLLAGAGDDTPAEALARARRWQARKADAGYACITWSPEWGGAGGSPIEAVIFAAEEERYPVNSDFFSIGLGMCVPTVLAHCDETTRERFAAPAVRGEEIWCQLFSEPAAGSDLAGLRTRAVRDGDAWVVNGQKVWTSGAHRADYGILLTRTDPDKPKHAGLTMFWIDMKAPGVEVRPIHQMSGEREFNEVFLTDVRIPDSQRLGPVDGGWRVALYTLMNERLAVGRPRGIQPADLMALARTVDGEDGRPVLADPAFRQQLARWHVQAAGIRNTWMRAMTAISRGEAPGPESSIAKLVVANLLQELGAAAGEITEQYGIVVPPGDEGRSGFSWALLFSPGFRIAGGTDEILKNIIAERVLGLPGDLRADKDVAFRDLPRGV